MKKIIFILLLIPFGIKAETINKINGKAIDFVGNIVQAFTIDDYVSQVKTKVAETRVGVDGTFSLSFYNPVTRKIRIEVGKRFFYIYVQPNATYRLDIDGDLANYSGAKGRELDFYFLDLDSADINYKILVYDNYQFDFLEYFYQDKNTKSVDFVAQLDMFKINVEELYQADTSQFLKTYVKYSIASLDNLAFIGQRNEYEKYDFYIKPETVWYQNDRYMDYILHYYEQYEASLSKEVNEDFYKGILKGSPTLLMKSLGGDYALKNLRLRELIMIRMLSEVFYSGKYPQTNIVTILDSLVTNSMFKEHKNIAENVRYRLMDLTPGTKMPDFNLIIDGDRKFKKDYEGKHVYIQFVSDESSKSLEDLRLLFPLQQKYSKFIDFVTVLVTDKELESYDFSSFIKTHKIAWDFSVVNKNAPILKTLSVADFPYYLFMDATGNVVAAPALSPRPNNEYETIEKSFYSITRYYRGMEKY